MAKDKLTEYSATNASNDVIGDISVAEGMLPSAVNNALREQMTHLKNFSDGTDAIDALAVDNLKLDGNTISSTNTNGDITLDPNGTGDVVVSSGNVGINTASPAYTIDAASSGNTQIHLKASGQSDGLEIGQLSADGGSAITATNNNYLKFGTNNTERMRIDSSGNVGIGTASPNKVLHLETSGETVQRMVASTTNLAGFYFGDSGNGSIGQLIYDNSSDAMRFTTNASERMRVTAGGNLNIGKTADGIGTAGLALRGDVDIAQFTRSGGEPLELNRLATMVP